MVLGVPWFDMISSVGRSASLHLSCCSFFFCSSSSLSFSNRVKVFHSSFSSPLCSPPPSFQSQAFFKSPFFFSPACCLIIGIQLTSIDNGPDTLTTFFFLLTGFMLRIATSVIYKSNAATHTCAACVPHNASLLLLSLLLLLLLLLLFSSFKIVDDGRES